MLGSPCSPCCSQCGPDIVPSQARWATTWGAGNVRLPTGWNPLSSTVDFYNVGGGVNVVLTRDDTVANILTGVSGFGWRFDGGPFDSFQGVLEADRFGNVKWQVTTTVRVRAFLWAIPAASAPVGNPIYAVESQCGSPCWFWGGRLAELYITNLTWPGGIFPPQFYNDMQLEHYIGIESLKIGNTSAGLFGRDRPVLYNTSSVCDSRVERAPGPFTSVIGTFYSDLIQATVTRVALPNQFWGGTNVNVWDRFYTPSIPAPGRQFTSTSVLEWSGA